MHIGMFIYSQKRISNTIEEAYPMLGEKMNPDAAGVRYVG